MISDLVVMCPMRNTEVGEGDREEGITHKEGCKGGVGTSHVRPNSALSLGFYWRVLSRAWCDLFERITLAACHERL